MKQFKVTIDRPYGHIDQYGTEYKVNYGYILKKFAGDKEKQEVYILDYDYPIEEFEGKLVAIIKRPNDNNDKWVLSNKKLTIEEIKAKTFFLEKSFNSEIILYEHINLSNKGLYVHIPFCKNICSYCDFTKRIRLNEKQEYDYITRLLDELEHYQEYLNNNIVSIYIGGGTPNHLAITNLKRLLEKIASFELSNVTEYTIEINAELLTLQQVALFRQYGINRVSIGVQTFKENHIKLLNRKHTLEDVFNAVKLLKENNITNINLDLMYGFFGQSLDDVKADLQTFYSLEVFHLSYYSLILEEKTKFHIDYNKGLLPTLDNDLVGDMYEYIINDLAINNYNHYEISNFSKDRYESIHNKIYWNTLEYIGVGLGASGYLNKIRYDNHKKINDYFKNYIETQEFIDTSLAKSEFLMMGLRLIKGVSLSDYTNRFNSQVFDDFEINKFIETNYLVIECDYLKFTQKGIFFSNYVLSNFI